MNFTKGLKNLFTPSIINFILATCLIIILILIYLKTNKLDLFTDGDYLTTFINNYINKTTQKNAYMQILNQQEQKIQLLTQKVSKLINPS